MVIVDTDILIKCLRGEKADLTEVTTLLENKAALLTPIQLTELYAHALNEELPMIKAFLDLFQTEDFNARTAELAGEYLQQYRPHYPFLTSSDCLVGATAALTGAEIYTEQAQHYPMTEVRLYYKTIKALTSKTKPRLADNFRVKFN